MMKFLAQYIPNESTIPAPLRRLICDNVQWEWQDEEESAMAAINSLLTSAPVLAPYDVSKDVCVQADASVAACLMQDGRPVAYASLALIECEQRYVPIEKELLAICYACKKYRQHILGKQVLVESDHKPLEVKLRKEILLSPHHLQRMLLRLQPYDLRVEYKRGKEMHIADALSSATVDPAEQYLDDGWMIYEMKTINACSTMRMGNSRGRQARIQTCKT